MKLHLYPLIERSITRITANSLAINHITYTQSIQISQNYGVTLWDISSINGLTEADIEAWAIQTPELIILGTGENTPTFLPAKWLVRLSQLGIGIECMNTHSAVRTYNILLNEERNVFGAFIMNTSLKV